MTADVAEAFSRSENEAPFPGLRPFTGRDHRFFFGREDQTFALYRLLRNHRFVAVVGSSGSGKSSIVQAGLLPLLEQENAQASITVWQCATTRPGHDPIEHLANTLASLRGGREDPLFEPRCDRIRATLQSSSLGIAEAATHALQDPNAQLVLLVDQFEELFRYLSAGQVHGVHELARRREEATKFVQLLLRATRSIDSRVRVLITMRSDFIGECSRFQGLPEAVSEAQFLVPALSRDQREETIRGPVQLAGGTISSELVERLLNDSNDELDQLPVLQHCLARLWGRAGAGAPEAAGGRILTEGHYRDIGGLTAALSTHADEIFSELPGHEKTIELIFRSLAEVDKEGRAIRRACPFGQLVAETGASREEVRTILEKFRADDCSFVMPSASELATSRLADATMIDVGHEALLRRWIRVSGDPEATGERADKRDVGWLRQEKADGERYQFLRSCVDPDSLNEARLSDDQIRRYWNWWLGRKPNAAWAARYGGNFEDVEQLVDRSYAAQTRTRKLKTASYTAAAVTVLLLGSAGVYFYERQKLQDKAFRNVAESAMKISKVVLDSFNQGQISTDLATRIQDVTGELYDKFDDLGDSPDIAALKLSWLTNASDFNVSLGRREDTKRDAALTVAMARTYLAKDPENPRWQRWLYAGLFRLGDVHLDEAIANHDTALLKQALEEYKESRRIGDQLLAQQIANPPLNLAGIDHLARERFDLAFAINKVGEALQVQNDIPGALSNYREALELAKTIENASRMEWQLQSATTLVKIATALARSKDLDGAIDNYSAAIEREERLYAKNSSNKIVRSNLASAYEQRSLLYKAQRNFDRSQHDLSLAIDMNRRLSDQDPRDVSALQRVLRVYSRMYVLLDDQPADKDPDFSKRIELLQMDVAAREKLVAERPTDEGYRDSLKRSKDRLNELVAKIPVATKE
jgi:tetratricopeptide (TPR) repeat protein